MSTDNGSGASQDSTGSAEESQVQTQTQIKPEDHMRAIDDLKKFKARSRELESQLQAIQSEMEEQKTKKLSDSNDFKTLYEQATAKNKEWEAKHQRLKDSVVYNEKYKAAQSALINAGVRKEALKLLEKDDFEPMIVEHTSEGRMIVNGVDEYVDAFKKNYGALIFEEKKATRVNGSAGNQQSEFSGQITPSKLYEIEKKHGIGSTEYRQAFSEYKKQKTT